MAAATIALEVTYNPRIATLEDIPDIRLLIDASFRTLHTSYYTQVQITAALKSIYGVDTTLILDKHYFVIEHSNFTHPSDPKFVACGGWSNRNTLYGGDQYSSRNNNFLSPANGDAAKIRAFFVHPDWARKGLGKLVLDACEIAARESGFRKAEMGATLSGVPFYTKMGYVKFGRNDAALEEGVVLEVVSMKKELCCAEWLCWKVTTRRDGPLRSENVRPLRMEMQASRIYSGYAEIASIAD
jgi:hypothetical protein